MCIVLVIIFVALKIYARQYIPHLAVDVDWLRLQLWTLAYHCATRGWRVGGTLSLSMLYCNACLGHRLISGYFLFPLHSWCLTESCISPMCELLAGAGLAFLWLTTLPPAFKYFPMGDKILGLSPSWACWDCDLGG